MGRRGGGSRLLYHPGANCSSLEKHSNSTHSGPCLQHHMHVVHLLRAQSVLVAAGFFTFQVRNCQQSGKASQHSGLCLQHHRLALHLLRGKKVLGDTGKDVHGMCSFDWSLVPVNYSQHGLSGVRRRQSLW
jgi:hypothetical protein